MADETTTETATTQTETASSSQTAESTTGGTTLLTAAESTTEQASSEQTQHLDGKTATTAESTKTDEQKTEETKTETKLEGAPEKYEFANADAYDKDVLDAFSKSAKDANLTQDAAQKLLDGVAPELAKRTQAQTAAVQQQWAEASNSDKEFGGEHIAENLGVAKRALQQFGTPELAQFLETTKLGNHPEVIRLLYRAGKAISEDTVVTGGSKTNAAKPEDVFYPTMKK